MEPRRRLRVLTTVAALLAARPAAARVLLTQAQGLALAFPSGERVERRTAYLGPEQRRAAQERGRVKIESGVWTYYVGVATAGVTGYAYFDSHVVRTAPETLMIVLEPDGSTRSVEVLSFLEPEDYLPNPRWLSQFHAKTLRDDLVAHRGVRNLSGASLTSDAAAAAVRRVLAVHAEIHAPPPSEKVKSPSR